MQGNAMYLMMNITIIIWIYFLASKNTGGYFLRGLPAFLEFIKLEILFIALSLIDGE